MEQDFQARRIADLGASDSEVDELLVYTENRFDLATLDEDTVFPLPDEDFVDCWRSWAARAQSEGVFEVLKKNLPQLSFPISEGISQTPSYRRATLQGASPADCEGAIGLPVDSPETLELEIYPSLAGGVPVLCMHGRRQFETLVRALSKKNEPVPVLQSMGAVMIAGFNNWTRMHALRDAWEATPPDERETPSWPEEFARIRPQKHLYQDRFMLLSDGPYSAVPAADLGLSDEEWKAKSLVIRRDHECVHYFTRRLFGSMRNNLLDELIADYHGIVAAEGHYRADWFLRFVGLENYPAYREGGRLDLYRGDPPLSDGAFRILQTLVVRASQNLETFDREELHGRRTPRRQACVIAALAACRLDELAAEDGAVTLKRSMDEIARRLGETASEPTP